MEQETEELKALEFIKNNFWKGEEDGKETGSIKYIVERIKFLQNQRNQQNRQIATLKKANLN
jgi:hypothetical protein